MSNGPQFLTYEETTRLIREVLENSDSGKLAGDEVENAHAALLELAIEASLLQLWRKGDLTIGWDVATQDITWGLASTEEDLQEPTR